MDVFSHCLRVIGEGIMVLQISIKIDPLICIVWGGGGGIYAPTSAKTNRKKSPEEFLGAPSV